MPSGADNKTKRLLLVLFGIIAALAVAAVAIAVILIVQANARNQVILRPELVIYEEGSASFQILASDDTSVTVSSLDDISEEMVLAAGVTEQTPNGLLRKFDLQSAQQVEGGYKVATRQAALTEAIEKCDIKATVGITEDGDYIIEQNGADNGSSFIEQAFADSYVTKFVDKTYGPLNVYCKNTFDVNIYINGWDEVVFTLSDTFDMGADLSDLQKGWEDGGTIFSKDFRPFTIQAGILPIVFTPNLTVDFRAQAQMATLCLESHVRVGKTVGIEYSTKNGMRAINEDISEGPDLGFTGPTDMAEATASGDVKATLSCLMYGIAGPDISVGLNADMSTKLTKLANGEHIEGAFRVPGLDWELKGTYNIKVWLPISGHFVLKVPTNPFDLEGSLEEIANFTIFDTGDAITLLDVHERCANYITYTTNLTDGCPNFEFDYPDDWTFKEGTLSNGGNINMRFDIGHTQGVPGILCDSVSYGQKLADAALTPYAGSPTNGYVVATAELSGISPDYYKYLEHVSGSDTEFIALVPAQWAGNTYSNLLNGNVLSGNANRPVDSSGGAPCFSYDDSNYTHDKQFEEYVGIHNMVIEFYCYKANSLEDWEREEVINVLSSFRKL